MKDLKKKQKIAFILTLITLANIWASLTCEVPNVMVKGSAGMVTVVLIGITIERWARFLKAYINYEIDKKTK
jgi:hypothetical protein